ncbi:N-acetylmuramoyl-L-alanine amidase family protein [Schnuerera sp.]|uniref:N-acetylmuramoyl-L-alanine amidase family protein n=1 Tax=Schnuerera sp. TaxID=2794844 RepID=UPI002CF629DF|nr:N-acetylmuramoyl-L-alanine amidase family protein [Schnuerera sp.]HSH35324.1 N-acetylmuramoyl-L-alanine amidase family protein [Schnuerera sp.]
MKKWKVVLSFLLIFVFFNLPVFAANNNHRITVSMDGQKFTVKEVPVVFDGQAVFSDIPTFIHPINDYTLVPIRFIAERYGAEVSWEQKTKTATLKQEGKEIKITINSQDMYINGEKKPIEGSTTPKLVTFSNKDSRTMVPLRLVSEALGFEVGWDNVKRVPFINTKVAEEDLNEDKDRNENNQTREITNVLVEKGSTNSPKITIKGTEKLNYSTDLLKNPNRLVIDVENSVLNLKDSILFEGGVGRIDVNNKQIKRISMSQFSSNPDVVRIVINLTENMDFDVVSGEDGKSLTVSFVNRVEKIEKEIIDGKEAIVIYNTEEPEIKTLKLSDPERIVVDLLDSSLEGGTFFSYNYNISFIKGVRVSQFVPDNLYKPNDRIVRLVLDIEEGIHDPNVRINKEDNKIIIIPETSLGEIIDYNLKGNKRTISINTIEKTDYDIEYHRDKNTMIVTLPSNLLDIEEGFMNIRDGLINDITIREADNLSNVILTFRRGVEYDILSKDIDDKITISLERDENIKPSDRIIVIDPGHGGYQPGTIQNGIEEKDVNLSVSLKLNESLEELGYTTIMTRDDDSFVDLYDRAKIANRNQADLFISIHANSIGNPNISGIQVLYHSKDKDKVKKEDTLALAKIMMEELTNGTGAEDKGLLPREKTVVIRDTSMPSVLIELGFLTNKEEARLLTDDDYQNLLVESIIKGIEKYLDLY